MLYVPTASTNPRVPRLTASPTQAKTVVSPLDRVKILFQASNPRFAKYSGSWTGAIKAMREIYVLGGARGLFRGHSATLLRIFPYAGIKFLAYEQIRAIVIPGPEHETHVRRFLSGSMAGTVSVFCTYPLEVIRVRLAFETKATAPNGERSTLASICRTIYHEHPRPPAAHPPQMPAAPLATATPSAVIDAAERALPKVMPNAGLANFYRGFTPTLWGMLPYAGCSFLTHDLAGDLLRHPSLAARTTLPGTATERKPAQLTAGAELFAGGLAGFVSQTASYPLEVIRRRMQVGGAVGDGHRLRMREVAGAVWREAGVRGFFVGLGIGYFKVVPMSATSFFVYERAKFWLGI